MTWSSWAILGFLLLAAELLTPGVFVICFFGVGALLVSAIVGLGLKSTAVAWICFGVLSVATLGLFRSRLRGQLSGGSSTVEDLIGGIAISEQEIAPHGDGTVEHRGSIWSAENTSDSVILAGEPCVIVSVSGLKLGLKPQRSN